MAVAFTAASVYAQSTPGRSFEVASVKKSDGTCVGRAMEFTPGRIVLRCVNVRALIQFAWNGLPGSITHRVVRTMGGPSWINSTQYDIEATATGTSTAEMVGPLLQNLLKQRLQLQIHKEPKESPVYFLTAPNGRSRLTAADGKACVVRDWSSFPPPSPTPDPSVKYCGTASPHGTRETQIVDYYSVDMPSFAATLQADREVVDRTGIAGKFDIHLEYARDMGSSGPVMLNGVPSAPVNSDSTGAVSIFTALQKETGLKLVAGTAPLDVIVVDHVEPPTGN